MSFLKDVCEVFFRWSLLLITCSIHLWSFLVSAVHVSHSGLRFHSYCLHYLIVMLHFIFYLFQLAVISLGKNFEFWLLKLSKWLQHTWQFLSWPQIKEFVDFNNSSWNSSIDGAFELPSLSYVSDVYFFLLLFKSTPCNHCFHFLS